MWREVGLVRLADGLARAIAVLRRLESALPPGASEARNLLTVGRLVAAAALARPESRGGHYRADHPTSDPLWRRRAFLEALSLGGDGVAADRCPRTRQARRLSTRRLRA